MTVPAHVHPAVDSLTPESMKNYDEEQVRLMEEMCILVDPKDRVVGAATKKYCHRWETIQAGLGLHRAFSVFLFDSQNRLCLQQRAASKITFPDYWTNTCCSHPLYSLVAEREEKDHLGVRLAARRKLEHELGLAASTLPNLDRFRHLARVLYKAPSCGEWGEHEIDSILFLKGDFELQPNENEVQAVRFVTPEELRQLMLEAEKGEVLLTPWFRLICEHFLFEWWSQLDELMEAEGVECVGKAAQDLIYNMIQPSVV